MKASSPSKKTSCNVVSDTSSSSSSPSSRRFLRLSSKGLRASARSSIIAHGAAESVAPTNYEASAPDFRLTTPIKQQTHLILRVRREVLAVKVGGQDNTPRSCWVFRRDHICERPRSDWCVVREAVFVDVPVQGF